MFIIRHPRHRTGVHTDAVTISSGTPGPPIITAILDQPPGRAAIRRIFISVIVHTADLRARCVPRLTYSTRRSSIHAKESFFSKAEDWRLLVDVSSMELQATAAQKYRWTNYMRSTCAKCRRQMRNLRATRDAASVPFSARPRVALAYSSQAMGCRLNRSHLSTWCSAY